MSENTFDDDVFVTDLARAAGIEVSEIDLDEDLLGLGVDSVRLMALLDGWRGRGIDVSFPDIAGAATVREAVTLLRRHSPIG